MYPEPSRAAPSRSTRWVNDHESDVHTLGDVETLMGEGVADAMPHRRVRRTLSSLSAVAVAIAVIGGVSAPSAAAFKKQVALVIKTHAPTPPNGKSFEIEWETQSGDTKNSGTQKFDKSSQEHTSSQAFSLHFKFSVFGRGNPFDGDSFTGFVFNPLFERPEVQLKGKGRTFFTDKDGYDEGQSRNASIGEQGWELHFRAKREGDSSGHKNFTLWIWITD
jgi:hypothetical protein